ncbi:MAG: glutamate-cysteine ligase family protein [Adhaeribacter sp.]
MSYSSSLRLFEAYGLEIEYMIVDRQTLQVRPLADKVLEQEAGRLTGDVERGAMAWSNELVLHVLELKTNGPYPDLEPLAGLFQQEVSRVNELLAPQGAMLLPTGMHPLMDPARDTRLWPHDYQEVYRAYDRIFNCQGHGWANLQSTHLNLPFSGDEEFGKLHAAVRLLLPLLPALSASTPLADGQATGFEDTRLEVYRHNQARIPSIAGSIVPEAVFNRQDYESRILQRLYHDIAPFDPEGLLQDEFLNSRGAIARFSRGAIEIRLLDTQECPRADLAIAQVVVALLQQLVQGNPVSLAQQKSWHEEELAEILLQVIAQGQDALLTNSSYLHVWGIKQTTATARQVWQHLWRGLQESRPFPPAVIEVMDLILGEGSLSYRILRATGLNPNPEVITGVYRQLAQCLATGSLFVP